METRGTQFDTSGMVRRKVPRPPKLCATMVPEERWCYIKSLPAHIYTVISGSSNLYVLCAGQDLQINRAWAGAGRVAAG